MQSKRGWLWVAVLASALFFPFLGQVHLFDWDELNFAEIAREMIVSGDYLNIQIAFQPFYEKPPLFFWLQALSMHLWGINEFAARFPNAVVGVVAMLLLFKWGSTYRDQRFGWLWVMAYAGSMFPFIYFKSGIIDPLFNLLIFSAVWLYFRGNGPRNGLLLGGLIGLAILTKGPVALLIFGLVVVVDLLTSRGMRWQGIGSWLLFGISLLAVGGSWFLIQIARGDVNVVVEFIQVQVNLFSKGVAGHDQPWFYHPVVLLIGCFPASIFALGLIWRRSERSDASRGMQILFWVVLILFSIVTTKIVHYSSLAYYPISFFAARILHEGQMARWMKIGILFIGIIWVTIFAVFPWMLTSGLNFLKAKIADPQILAMLDQSFHFSPLAYALGPFFGLMLLSWTWQHWRKNSVSGWMLFGTSTLTVFLFMLTVVPQVERITQGAAVEMYQSFRGKEVVLNTGYFKSYGYLFYSDADSIGHSSPSLERPHFTVSQIRSEAQMEADSVFMLIRESGGYQLYYRQLYYWHP